MLKITIPGNELWDERTETFVYDEPVTLELEHSLTALDAWESKWHKPFLSRKEQTPEETIDYIKCMTLNNDVPDEAYQRLTSDNYKEINAYIENPMSATTIYNEEKKSAGKETITAELIYYWMTGLQIPFSCADWHLNKLIKLIEVASIKNNPPKKKSRKEILQRNAELNARRKKELGTKG